MRSGMPSIMFLANSLILLSWNQTLISFLQAAALFLLWFHAFYLWAASKQVQLDSYPRCCPANLKFECFNPVILFNFVCCVAGRIVLLRNNVLGWFWHPLPQLRGYPFLQDTDILVLSHCSFYNVYPCNTADTDGTTYHYEQRMFMYFDNTIKIYLLSWTPANKFCAAIKY